jgi:hypothetical protein
MTNVTKGASQERGRFTQSKVIAWTFAATIKM